MESTMPVLTLAVQKDPGVVVCTDVMMEPLKQARYPTAEADTVSPTSHYARGSLKAVYRHHIE